MDVDESSSEKSVLHLPDSLKCEEDESETERNLKRSRLPRRQVVQSKKICAKTERNASLRKVSVILQKSEDDRTSEEFEVLSQYSDAVEQVQQRWRKRQEAKRRLEEFEEPPDLLRSKCQILAQAIAQSQHLVVYTGAGISTAAKIPDYRGTNGIWTRLQQGKDIGAHDLSLAEPTYTHMALFELYRRKILKYVVSQNCDGLHLRSGLPRTALSELHGNMYVEVCKTCKPHKEYWRLFDVTENTGRYSHKTSRMCYECGEPVLDTIVHFGERGSLQWPLNWSGACKNAELATTILCLGSSLKVLKKYPWLWRMDKPAKTRPNLYIVNLQWTPKDDVANVKLHGKCDQVMSVIMDILGIQVGGYDKRKDPIFAHSTLLSGGEEHTTTQPVLKEPEDLTVQIEDCQAHCDNNKNKDSLPTRSSSFTIDDILHRPNRPPEQRFHYHQFPEFLCYPYQTSFLYPGLHSIINPRHDDGPTCDYCQKQYDSRTCLFYKKHEPKFIKQRFRLSKSDGVNKEVVCICCDYTSDEEGTMTEMNENGSSNNKEQDKKIQAGWFGKGYKKNRRLKKK